MVAIPLPVAILAATSLHSRQSPESAPPPAAQGGLPNYYGSVRQVTRSDFPDPALLYYNGITYAYSTNSGSGTHIPVATSTDNTTFNVLDGKDALPGLAAWENGNNVWAPDVVQIFDSATVSQSKFVMYYASGTLSSKGKYHCIGAATASTPLGPFVPISDQPFICPNIPTSGGAIDPEGFLDPVTGRRYVAYKQDGNAIGHGGSCGNGVAPKQVTPIMLQEVSADDGVTLIGAPQPLLDRDEADGPLIEAPSLHRSEDGIYFLFYASNCFDSPEYSTSYATSTNVWGPYVKAQRPLLHTGNGASVTGPGGLDVPAAGDGLVGFHGRVNPDNTPLVRAAYTARLVFDGRIVGFATS
ncbi:uncharacterized protein AB675_9879 [Cyphellophora attinorum]|uniref:Glycoside hydrolase family 43 protein n=1 Tax=Cyphellophora attinorum TaxID=1664694 RepID=A0A0N1HD90_9EURO|nr:uncharacterized protein AB675_9879 [Phialophora attinorum]KPI42233.1 hypothetical protein AB675_9879 [Phialophora attinorum]